MDTRVTTLIQEFCNYLTEYIPEFQELKDAKESLESDLHSKKLWDEKEEQINTVDLLKKQGLPTSIEQEASLAQRLKEMRENPITMRYLKAVNAAKKVAGPIGSQLQVVTGVDFSPKKGCK